MWLEDVLVGTLASGVNGPTLALLNAALLACILSLVALLAVFGATYTALIPHLAALLVLAVGLVVSVNWLVGQTGTVASEQQKRELFGTGEEAVATAGTPEEEEEEVLKKSE